MNSRTLFLLFLLFSVNCIGCAQEVSVFFQKDLNFGEFYLDGISGGNICISNSGSINPSSNVKLINTEYHPATLLVSTLNEEYIEVQIEAVAENLKSKDGGNLRLRLNQPENTYYRLKKGVPLEINLGGCLEIEPGGASSSATHLGNIHVNVIILNE